MHESGVININKQSGVTSFWVVKQVKKILRAKRVGHCGTLDPLATGVLIILFGNATKKQDLFLKNRKTYTATVRLGIKTDSGDISGQIIEEKDIPSVTNSKIVEVLNTFIGKQYQVPPMYSAIKVGGTRLYKLAREGKTIKRNPREIEIYSLGLIDYSGDYFSFRVKSSSGTYIRTLAEDICERLGTVGTIAKLCREEVYPFSINTALDGNKLNSIRKAELLKYKLDIDKICLNAKTV